MFVATAAFDLYVKCGETEKARTVFDSGLECYGWRICLQWAYARGSGTTILCNTGRGNEAIQAEGMRYCRGNEARLLQSGRGALSVYKVGCTGFGAAGCRDGAR